jgi:signal peptide peptidase SppA
VRAVVLDVASPGGTVAGTPELARAVRDLRNAKPTIGFARGPAASAAFWVLSQSDRIIAAPSADGIGSIGVFSERVGVSRALDAAGIDVDLISSSERKVEGHPALPFSDAARAHMQSLVDDAASLFVADVARGRKVSPATVRARFGDGLAFNATQAQTRGLVDAIGELDSAVAEAVNGPSVRARAEASGRAVLRIHARLGGIKLDEPPAAYDPDMLRLRARAAGVRWPPRDAA